MLSRHCVGTCQGKRAHTQLVRKRSQTVVSARWVTVHWSWLKQMKLVCANLYPIKKKKHTGGKWLTAPSIRIPASEAPQWGPADAEVKVPSAGNTDLKGSPFEAWSGSVNSHTCYAYCKEFLPYFYPSCPFTCIFPKPLPIFFPVLAVAKTSSCVGAQNKIGHPAGCRFPCWVPAEYK